jgi:hypothetical protein
MLSNYTKIFSSTLTATLVIAISPFSLPAQAETSGYIRHFSALNMNVRQCISLARRAAQSEAIGKPRQTKTSFYGNAAKNVRFEINCVEVGQMSAVGIITSHVNGELEFVSEVQDRLVAYF